MLYEKTLKQSVIDKKTDQKEAEELKKIYNHFINKKSEIMKKTQFKVEDIFGDKITKGSISPEQITNFIKFLAKIM